jgi:hypothetical protein
MLRLFAKVTFLLTLLLTGYAHAEPTAPNSLVIVACRVDDLTGQPGRHDPKLAARDWRDLELHVNEAQQYECRRDVIANIEDATQFNKHAPADLIPLNPNFGNPGQCARIGVVIAQSWNDTHPGWGVVAVGCPSPTFADADADGAPDLDQHGNPTVVQWRLPSCPTYLPGTSNRMKCVYDESVI